jgi:predicted oxidoreductase
MQGEAGVQQKGLYVGNSVKSMHVSVEGSLKKLKTSYIDILYVHWWDWETSVEEVMNGLHTLVQQGKVLYLVRVENILDIPHYYYFDSFWFVGYFRYPCMGSVGGKSVRS